MTGTPHEDRTVPLDSVEAGATPDEASPRAWVLYLLECAGERLYAGITNDLAARFAAHRAGRGARFTKAFPPVRIVGACELASRSLALKAEYALKRQPRAAKLAFLAACGTPLVLDCGTGAEATP